MMVLERPIFWLGLAGLSPPQRALLTAYLPGAPGSLPAWRIAKFTEADAWCVSGTASQLQDDGTLLVPDSRRGQPPLRIDFRKVDRPLIFTKPLATPEMAPLEQFDPASERAVQMVLKKFEVTLQPLRAQFSVGALIHRCVADLPQAVYHVVHQSTLLAVVDLPKRHVEYLADASVVQLEQAIWSPRPVSEATAPARLLQASLSEVMWQFAQRSASDVLPSHFSTGPIRLRHPPRVPVAWLKESQSTLLRMLAARPTGMSELLLQNASFNRPQLERDLSALYFDGAIASAHVDLAWLPASGVASRSALLS